MLGKNIQDLVLVKLEEYSAYNPDYDGPLAANDEELKEIKPIQAYIEKHLGEAADEVLRVAPISMLFNIKYDAVAVEDEDDMHIGTIELPDEYLRLHTLQMTDWKRSIHVASKEGDIVDNHQQYRWLRGSHTKPVVIEYGENENEPRYLKYYSVLYDHTVKEFRYIPHFDGEIEYNNSIAEAIALNCAKKVCEVFERRDSITIIEKELNSVLQNVGL